MLRERPEHLQDRDGQRAQGHDVRLAYLHALCRDAPVGGAQVDLAPFHLAEPDRTLEHERRELHCACAREP
jgi:hypothetical protein